MAASYNPGADSSPKNRSHFVSGTPKRNPFDGHAFRCAATGSRALAKTRPAIAGSRAKIETQSRVLHAGTTPSLLIAVLVGFSPTMLLNDAGTRPDPAVSVPNAKSTMPDATATADPELDPPEMYLSLKTLEHAP
jgi:hypothetical protein